MPSPHTVRHTPPPGQIHPASIWQLALQPSPPSVLWSSQVSAPLTVPSPQWTSLVQAPPSSGQVNRASFWQVAVQPSPLVLLPSSHCSPATLRKPSPQLPTSTQFL